MHVLYYHHRYSVLSARYSSSAICIVVHRYSVLSARYSSSAICIVVHRQDTITYPHPRNYVYGMDVVIYHNSVVEHPISINVNQQSTGQQW